MTGYTIVSIILIILMFGLVGLVLAKICTKDKKSRIQYIKGFKKGKFTIIYVVAIPLFVMTLYYAGDNFGIALLKAITYSINLVVLKFDQAIVLADVNLAFKIAIYLCYVLVLFNAILFACSCLGQSIINAIKQSRFKTNKANKCLLVGYNQENIKICRSSIKNANSLIVDVMNKEQAENLYVQSCTYKSCKTNEHIFKYIEKIILKESKRAIKDVKKGKNSNYKFTIFVNFLIDKDNLVLCSQLMKIIKKVKAEFSKNDKKDELWNRFLTNTVIYVFGADEFEDVYEKYNEQTELCIKYLNKQRQIATDFILKYPLTQYMNKNILDTNTCLVDKNAQINVILIGFGKTNQQIFLSALQNDQFASKDTKGKIINHKVNYHIFDKEQFDVHKHLNDTYYRYNSLFFDKKTKIINSKDYLELPSLPIEEFHHHLNINKIEFYHELEKCVSNTNKSLNYIIVSLGNDYVNIEMSNKIINKLKQCKKLDKTHVFIHINDKNLTCELFPKENLPIVDKKEKQNVENKSNNQINAWNCKNVHCFGCETTSIYNFSRIVNEQYYEMAYTSNCIYSMNKEKELCFDKESIQSAKNSWNSSSTPLNRDSSLYACLSLRTKMHLLGLDIAPKKNETDVGISENEYLNIYAQKFAKKIIRKGEFYDIKYDLSLDNSRRCVLAYLEHNRWNAFYFFKGFIPASIQDIIDSAKKQNGWADPNNKKKASHGRDYEIKTHGCITTRDGLIALRKLEAKCKNTTEEKEDTVQFDYFLMDNAYILLEKVGYKIIKKQ